MRPGFLPSLGAASLALLALFATGTAQAAPADYRCDNGQSFRALMTPRDATVTLDDGQKLTLRRVRDRAEARFVNNAGTTLSLSRSQAELVRKDQPTLNCKKVVTSLEPEKLYGQGATRAGTAPSSPAAR